MAKAGELDPTIRIWAEVFNGYEIPLSAYPELLRMAIHGRAEMLGQGKSLPQIGAEYLLSLWIGPNGLKARLKQAQINQGRALPQDAAGACERCHGTGLEIIAGEGARRCDHKN